MITFAPVAAIAVIYREKVSGKDVRNRPMLAKAIDVLGTGDILVVAEWDGATRSMVDGIEIKRRIHDWGALIKVLDNAAFGPKHAARPRLHCLPIGNGRG